MKLPFVSVTKFQSQTTLFVTLGKTYFVNLQFHFGNRQVNKALSRKKGKTPAITVQSKLEPRIQGNNHFPSVGNRANQSVAWRNFNCAITFLTSSKAEFAEN